jgi:hypothetical protein
MLRSRQDAYELLRTIGAPARLITHVQLVGEAADLLMEAYADLKLTFDRQHTELGVAVHDAGKALFPEELNQPGSKHEPAGQVLMLEHGVQEHIARCCVSHAAWRQPDVTFEELSVALADKLWKGKREAELELTVIDRAAEQLRVDRWTVFDRLDAAFEAIADGASDRLARSVQP